MSIRIQPQTTSIDGLSIRFAEGGAGPRQALLLNPWPESIYAYERVWPSLADAAQLFAIDLPGFGGSQRRDGLMNPKAMGDFIVRIADALELDRPHIVAPDIGTGGAAVPITLGSPLKDWVEATDVQPYRQIGGRKNRGDRTEHHRRLHANPMRFATTTSPPTTGISSPNPSPMFRPTQSSYPSSAPFCPRSTPQCASSRAAKTRWCRR